MAAESVVPVSLLKADDLFQVTVVRSHDGSLFMSSRQPIREKISKLITANNKVESVPHK